MPVPAGNTKRRRPRLLMSAYACRPYHGSEPGVGWNRALQAVRDFDTWVLTEDAKSGPMVRRYLQEHGSIPGLEFVFIPHSPMMERWRAAMDRLFASWVRSRLWHRKAYRVARRLHAEVRFDLVHQVNFMTYREPGYLWKLGVPFIWGPWGGIQNYPWRFLPLVGLKGAIHEGVRSILNHVQLRVSRRVCKASAAAALLLACNSENQRVFAAVHGRTPEIIAGNGIAALLSPRPQRRPHSTLRLLWVGRLESIKGLPVLLQALTRIPASLPYELKIMGRGPKKEEWQRLAARLGVAAQVVWLPYLDPIEVSAEYQAADLFIFTSMRETVPTVIIEALAAGLPIIYLDHHGLREMVPPECGVGIAVRTPRQVAEDLAQAIGQLAGDAGMRERMGAASAIQARNYLWSRQGEELNRRMLQVLV
jgi:glycosyltransferase involved in cell wall biosynthesis